MERQMELLEGRGAWQLDRRSREAGRRGVQQARKALLEARRRVQERNEQEPHHPHAA